MKKILLVLALMATSVAISNSTPAARVEPPADCRITCTIYVPNGFGGMIGFSATAGNIFTSCETARERACAAVARNLWDILMDS